jgi:protein-tyrosine phosphatase
MAEAILRSLLRPSISGEVRVLSAGTAAVEGAPAAPFARQAARENELSLERFRSRPLTEDLVRDSALILCMERHHRDYVISMVPGTDDKVYLLSEWSGVGDEEDPPGIRDPIGSSIETYREVFRELKTQLTRSMGRLEDLLSSRRDKT